MKKKVEDRRPQKTRLALSEALISIMFEKKYDDIIVQEILDRANIGRSTFYMHYRDKEELLLDGLQGLQEMLEDAQITTTTSSNKHHEKVIGYSLAMFEHAYDHKPLYKSLSSGPGWMIVRQRIEDILVRLMKKEARPLYKKNGSSEVPFELFIYFLASTFISLMTWWFNYKNPIPPKEINKLFRELVLPTLAERLN